LNAYTLNRATAKAIMHEANHNFNFKQRSRLPPGHIRNSGDWGNPCWWVRTAADIIRGEQVSAHNEPRLLGT
jgi:hypothetical protein